MGFRITFQIEKFDKVIISNHVRQQILNHRYSMHLFIIKYIGLQSILFVNKLDTASSFKVFSIFNSNFLLIVLLT